MHADGAGTKIIYWLIGTGKKRDDLSVWKGIAQDALVMNIDRLIVRRSYRYYFIVFTIGRNKNLYSSGSVISTIISRRYRRAVGRPFSCHGVDIQSTGGETADVG